ncbi:putative disease resistance protein RGA3 [Hevea brasiliensis]|uniref:putative disease resistance protein RGA3 n=1 Tax=Hevea brasiliensis TaxID=3981 RepID=UPI0025EC5852|nr:putative disease resistance protein RGA3 [Hevea brasiliensis]XP_057990482.1 putative disease resistance protein RGA3 [Hevea brasiliensis]XP_057990483.1 putative disease resistance protein RGA3 [Hevea brasiliensis]XP_057990484.1 putative disease resistance protein RGA3 [Hevea brasiliensis]XP_057990485.1 putative disease resistance protein RGA3 [Hevea brasiliensis]XP_057990486.1 putative disease resistance protein RGA3 [Hevea brasiliensis]XP_057990487.1 putative disease resistance protein RG
MADAILSGIVVEIIKKLGSRVLQETRLWWGVKEELEKLRRTVSTIQAVLLDAEQQYSQKHQIKDWVDSLKDAFYDADDLLDEFSTDVLVKRMMTGNKMVKEVRLFFSSSNPFVYGLKMAHKIGKVRSKLDETVANRKFHLDEITAPMVEEREQTHSSLPLVVVGREDDKKKIIDFLLSSSYGENVSIISIVGVGGLGKTTLAQLAYNDVRVKSYFELKMWVCISENFDVKIVVEKILESLDGEKPKNLELNTLKDLLWEKINEEKYLLVLDDLWNEDSKKWFDFKDLLARGACGSKIIVTTRLENVAKMIRSDETSKLQGLCDAKSWLLFKKMAFKQEQVTSAKHEKIGREIVTKCVGVPLAIRAIGSLLYYKNAINEWESIKEKELLYLNEGEINIMKTLRLSYDHLPSHLKCCFAYCRLFPKGSKIDIRYLVNLWMAQGLIKLSDSKQSFRDVGLKYFKDLLWRSFFQEVEEDMRGNLLRCKMHDLMYDLVVQVAREDIILLNSDAELVKEGTRHVSIGFKVESWQKVASCLPVVTKVRTFTSFNWSKMHDIKEVECHEIFFKLSRVRSLNLCGLGIEKVPHSINKLKHIRYLDLSENKGIEFLPDSIIKLQNLQILYLVNCERLKQLPKRIKKLVNLQRLFLRGCVSLTHMPHGIGQLTSIENLSLFMVDKDNGVSKHGGALSELSNLNNLRDMLRIMNLRYVKNPTSEFEAANLKEKQHIQALRLSWKLGPPYDNDSDSGPDDVEKDEEMSLEELRPHLNLKSLFVFGCGRLMFPSWISSLTNLVNLRIDNCKKCQHFPPLDQFPSLKHLTIENLTDLECIESGINCDNALFFPSLEKLWLINCPNLKGWRRDTSTPQLLQFHCLFYLEIRSCPNLTSMPLIPSVETLVLVETSKKSLEDILKMKISVSQSTSSSISLSPLKILYIEGIEDLEVLPEDLWHLTSLEGLVIKACEELNLSDDVQWQYLRSLQRLQFANLIKLASLPKGLQHVPTLRRLVIKSCPNLISLPEWIGSLTVQSFVIKECPQLSESCKNNKGADWPKIAHIPNISIDGRWIQEDGCYKL